MHKLLLFNSDIKMFIIIVTSIDLGINDQNYWLSSQLIMPSSLLEVIYIILKKSFLNIILFSKTKTGIKNDAFKYILEVVINCFISLVEVFLTFHQPLSLPLIPFVRGEVLNATSSPPHLIVFSTLICLLSSSSSLPPLLPSSHLS